MEMLAVWLAIAFVFGLALAIGWSLMDLNQAHKKTAEDLTEHREIVARDYALRREVKEDLREIKETLGKIFEALRGATGNR